jgi:pSer/pThr/pTyr-binding forkhead associated (FHA) protein
MKVQVPQITAFNGPRLDANPDLPPTQISVNQTSQASSAKLKILKNDKTEEQVFNLKEGLNTIGRLSMLKSDSFPDIQILTTDKKISRNYHCAIMLQRKGDYYEALLRDNQSVNGTYLKNSEKPLGPDDEVFLGNQDVFIIGDTSIQVELE